MSTLDHLTEGRIGWNIVTGYLDSAARGVGMDEQTAHDDRYDVADEYMEVVYKLWEGSWEDDAVLRDRARGIFADPAKVHRVQSRGQQLPARRDPSLRALAAAHAGAVSGRRLAARAGVRRRARRMRVHVGPLGQGHRAARGRDPRPRRGGRPQPGANAALALTIFPIAYIFLKEPRAAESRSSVVFRNASQQLKTILASKNLWMALLFIALFYFSPGFSTPLFYRQTDELHFSKQAIGNLGVFGSAFAILAAILYSQLIKRLNIRILILVGIVTAAAGTLLFLFYSSWNRAVIIESQNGLFFGFAEVALIDLAARATPKGCEGLGYSLILSIRNVALFGADVVGSYLVDHKWPFSNLVFLNAGTTAIVLVLVPFLPAALMQSKDAPLSKAGSN